MQHRIGVFLVIMGAVTGLVALVSLFNTVFDLELGIGTRGSSKTPLPDSWEGVAALAIAGSVFAGIGGLLVSERVAKVFRTYRAVRWGVPLALLVGGYIAFIQIRYASYGGKLAYAAAKGDTETVTELLADGDYGADEIAGAWEEAVEERQLDTAALLAPQVLAKGDPCMAFAYATWKLELVQLLLDAGGDPSGCLASSEVDLMYLTVLRNNERSVPLLRVLHANGVRPGPNAVEEIRRINDPEMVGLLEP